jgi:hypothetical protein
VPELRKGHPHSGQLVALGWRQISNAHAFALLSVTTGSTTIARRDFADRFRKDACRPPKPANVLALRFRLGYVEPRPASLDRRRITRPADRDPSTIGASPEPCPARLRRSSNKETCNQENCRPEHPMPTCKHPHGTPPIVKPNVGSLYSEVAAAGVDQHQHRPGRFIADVTACVSMRAQPRRQRGPRSRLGWRSVRAVLEMKPSGETPHGGADRARRREWRRTHPEPTKPA